MGDTIFFSRFVLERERFQKASKLQSSYLLLPLTILNENLSDLLYSIGFFFFFLVFKKYFLKNLEIIYLFFKNNIFLYF